MTSSLNNRKILTIVIAFCILMSIFYLIPKDRLLNPLAKYFGYQKTAEKYIHPLSKNAYKLGQSQCLEEFDQLLMLERSKKFLGYNLVGDGNSGFQSFITTNGKRGAISTSYSLQQDSEGNCVLGMDRIKSWKKSCPEIQKLLFSDKQLVGQSRDQWLILVGDKHYVLLQQLGELACLTINKRQLTSQQLKKVVAEAPKS